MIPLLSNLHDKKDVFEQRLRLERADCVRVQLLVAVPVNMLLGCSAVPLMLLHGTLSYVLLWLGSILVLNAVRYAVARINAAPEGSGAQVYLLACTIGSALSGVTWATAASLFMDVSDPQSLFLVVILCGLAAGAMVQCAAHVWMAIAFVAPILISATAAFLCLGTLAGFLLAFDVMLFFAFLSKSGFYSQKKFRETQVLKHRATDLAAGLQDLVNNDPLTGLPNRAFFGYALSARIEGAAAAGGSFFLLLVDLDNFKSINDTLGHSAGDIVLKEVAARLSRADGGRHDVARLGGDEFAILLAADLDDAAAKQAAERIVLDAGGAFVGCGHTVAIGISAGLAKFPDDGTTDEELLARSDLALYAAKGAGRQTWQRFDATLLEAANLARDIELDLPRALEDGSLEVWFQPQVRLADARLVGLEALIRWKHPRHGWLAPPLIVSAGVRLRLSEALTGLVLDAACALLPDLAGRGLADVVVAVNVSPSELGLYRLPDCVARRIEAHGIAPGRLEIEITEDAFIAGDRAMATLNALSAMGVRLAIDDFGTGCSSIAYLRTLRVDRIKIDRCFVSGFAQREGDRILVRAILGIGQSFGIEVVAEGVETQADAGLLESFGCPVAQGFHFGRPMRLQDLRGWIADFTEGVAPVEPATVPSGPFPIDAAA